MIGGACEQWREDKQLSEDRQERLCSTCLKRQDKACNKLKLSSRCCSTSLQPYNQQRKLWPHTKGTKPLCLSKASNQTVPGYRCEISNLTKPYPPLSECTYGSASSFFGP